MSSLYLALAQLDTFSRHIVGRPLRPYQTEPAAAILASVFGQLGHSITVEMSRQAGKNEMSAQLEAYLLNLYQRRPVNAIKCAPTFKPQVINSKLRLESTLNNPLNAGHWRSEMGYMTRLGDARVIFYSAEPSANVVGATAHVLMEFDEAQDIGLDKHDKDFMPMGATTNVTRAYFGTAWDDATLLERQKQTNLDAERKDGIRRHFEYPWWVVAEHNLLYGRYVEGEKARLGESHPMFKTQYLLQPIAGQGRFLSEQQRAQLIGDHARLHSARAGRVYVAGVDVAGEDEEATDAALRSAKPRKDSTVITIAEVERTEIAPGIQGAALRVVEHLWWTGRKHADQLAGLLDVLHNVWHVARCCVDATGVGAGVASFLLTALGESIVEDFTFSVSSKSQLGYGLLAAINAGGFKVYAETEQSPEAAEFWREAELARYQVRAQNQLNFYVDESDGHDDFLLSAALCARAGSLVAIAPAAAVIKPKEAYDDGRF
ncbi:MAG: hypothetical protein ACYC3S_18215 [Chloroflexota bacterium]